MKNSNVLKLNKNWTAIGFASLERCICLLFSECSNGLPKAQVVTPPPKGSYETWTWKDWSELKPGKNENVIVSATKIYKVPEVILLSEYDKVPTIKINFCRRSIWKRDNYTCQYCGRKPANNECSLDHVIPKSKGGDTSWTNCVLSCYQCNSQKADREPHEAFRPKDKEKARLWRGSSPMKLLSVPKKPDNSLFYRDQIKILDTWKHWIDRLYWEVTLENDMNE